MRPFTEQDVCDQCMLQLLFKHKCMLESAAQDQCAEIYGSHDGVCLAQSVTVRRRLMSQIFRMVRTMTSII